MRVGRASMRALWLAAALALAALASAEPSRRFPAEWRDRDLSRPLHDLFELEPQALHKERRRARNNKRAPHLPSEIASQMMLRASRSSRRYDVPQIECPPAADGMERFACPTPDRQGRYRCIDDHVLCDGFIDCPNGEDEDRQAYKSPSRRAGRRAATMGSRPLSKSSILKPALVRILPYRLNNLTDTMITMKAADTKRRYSDETSFAFICDVNNETYQEVVQSMPVTETTKSVVYEFRTETCAGSHGTS